MDPEKNAMFNLHGAQAAFSNGSASSISPGLFLKDVQLTGSGERRRQKMRRKNQSEDLNEFLRSVNQSGDAAHAAAVAAGTRSQIAQIANDTIDWAATGGFC